MGGLFSVAALVVDLLVTRTAMTHKVRFVIGSAFGERNDVVDFLNRDISAFPKAHLAERMLVDITLRILVQALPYRLPVE